MTRNNPSLSVADGGTPVCEHGPECEIRALWPMPNETHEQFVARLTQQCRAAVGGSRWPSAS